MFKKLSELWLSFVDGPIAAEMMLMNPAEWEWMQNYYLRLNTEGELICPGHPTQHLEDRPIPAWVYYKRATVFFSDKIEPGIIRLWRIRNGHVETGEAELKTGLYRYCAVGRYWKVVEPKSIMLCGIEEFKK